MRGSGCGREQLKGLLGMPEPRQLTQPGFHRLGAARGQISLQGASEVASMTSLSQDQLLMDSAHGYIGCGDRSFPLQQRGAEGTSPASSSCVRTSRLTHRRRRRGPRRACCSSAGGAGVILPVTYFRRDSPSMPVTSLRDINPVTYFQSLKDGLFEGSNAAGASETLAASLQTENIAVRFILFMFHCGCCIKCQAHLCNTDILKLI